MKEFKQRVEDFEQDFNKLQQKHKVHMYAANIMTQNGEVVPAIRMADLEEMEKLAKQQQEKENLPDASDDLDNSDIKKVE